MTYDIIVEELIVAGTQIDDFDGASITGTGSITFKATSGVTRS
jgi:hypothetical protein